jgi:FdhD protein
MAGVTARRRVLRVDGDAARWAEDRLVAEEPLEIRLAGHTLTVTMRTPGRATGEDIDLALGYCLTEGLLAGADDVATATACAPDTVDVQPAPGVAVPAEAVAAATRLTTTTSACGLCGAASVDAVRRRVRWPVDADPLTISAATLASLPEALRGAQRVFDRTGGLHAAGLFRGTGEPLAVREDVGRHNAVDKVLGLALRERWLPLRGCLLLVSGRASFELAQKALMAGIPLLAAVSAPSALAVTLAEEAGLTLVGFLRGPRMTVYAGAHRVLVGDGPLSPTDPGC